MDELNYTVTINCISFADERDERGRARANVPTSVDSEDLDLADTSDQLYISMRAVKVYCINNLYIYISIIIASRFKS